MREQMTFMVDEEGESRITIYKIDIEDIDRVDDLFPETHCTHSYDCCANWYDSRPQVIHEDRIYGFALVRQSSFLNV